jgi:hypothetical protein
LIQVKEICLFGSLGVVLPISQHSPENPHRKPDSYRKRDCHAVVQACICVDLSTVGAHQPWKKAIYQPSCILGHRFRVKTLRKNQEVLMQKAILTKPPGTTQRKLLILHQIHALASWFGMYLH